MKKNIQEGRLDERIIDIYVDTAKLEYHKKRYVQAIELFETYQKQSCRTRCKVMTANGVQTLTVPVVKVNGNHTLTKDIEIDYKESWQQIHLRCLESAYRKSAYFDYYFPYFEKIYRERFKTLVEMNDYCLKVIIKLLKVKKEYLYTEDFEKKLY